MEEEEDMLPPSPFWLQNSSGTLRRRRRSSGSVFFSSGAFVVLLVAIAAVFMFFVIPSVLSFTSQMFRPHLVKKSWDSLNLVLVLFAIVCGFLSRNSISAEQHSQSVGVNASPEEVVVQKSNPSTPPQWYEYNSLNSDPTVYSNSISMSRMRNSSSYPDLRQESQWVSSRDERWRFYDDTHVTNYRVSGSGSDQVHHHRRSYSWQEEPVLQPAQEEEVDHVSTKNIAVDTFVIRTEQVSYSPPPPISQPDPPPPRSPPRSLSPPPLPPPRKAKRTYQALGDNEKSSITQNVERNENLEVEKKMLPPPPRPPPPPPPLPPPLPPEVEVKRGKNVKKRGVITTKEFLITSLRRKKKKQRQKSVENFETLLESSPSSMPLHPPPSPPPPPPPLPPPPSVFHNLFSSKKTKPKKTHHSVSQQSPPPPAYNSTTHLSKTKAQTRPMMTTQNPPLPVKVKNFGDDDNANSGSVSPMMTRIPPPPPPPPFRMPKLKFAVVHGDFVRLKSNSSDDGGEDSPTSETSTPSSESPTPAMFCSSPDVNTKADTFIARFRAGLRLEKMNSGKEGRGMSNLGRGPGPDAREEGLGPN